jgi:hypothetical protein
LLYQIVAERLLKESVPLPARMVALLRAAERCERYLRLLRFFDSAAGPFASRNGPPQHRPADSPATAE